MRWNDDEDDMSLPESYLDSVGMSLTMVLKRLQQRIADLEQKVEKLEATIK